MKSLVRLIISLGVKLALIALIYAIVMGLTSCRGCSDADALSFSTANSDEVEVVTESSSESVMSDPSDETTPSSSFSQATENNQTTITETTKNSEVASSTQQTSQTTSSTVPAQEPTETTTAAPTTAPTSAQELLLRRHRFQQTHPLRYLRKVQLRNLRLHLLQSHIAWSLFVIVKSS